MRDAVTKVTKGGQSLCTTGDAVTGDGGAERSCRGAQRGGGRWQVQHMAQGPPIGDWMGARNLSLDWPGASPLHHVANFC